MRAAVLALLLLSGAASAPAAPAPTPINIVDPMIGTAGEGEGHTYPGANAPFGMVQLSPDTETGCKLDACYEHAAGYRYEDPTIQGFSHTHFSGTGYSDLGDLLVMPQAGAQVRLDPGDAAQPGSGYRSRFDHRHEVAHPGYYAVTLIDSGVWAVAQVEGARHQGYAHYAGQVVAGMGAVARPIRGPYGQCIAVISVTAVLDRLSEGRIR